ncbi:DUF1877 family protein [Pseudoalteromonas sp. CO348]|uniref:YfbM family protein n=1 Tax=unclassified Pseudoalteromonas TaxID=194690 RepID=UPI001023450E|nr:MULTISPECIES: YfbM family protein [unclassified Pseudoalteromonas]MCG7541075.1 YfbM family protein [Pseudoalteromonas sp. OF7H-1]RZG01021.1 DUF1877 family protein [Pseudoalteromonas sp. CO348]
MSMIASLKSVSEERLNEILAEPSKLVSYLYEDDSGKACDVDKAWHAIHFLLNKSVWEATSLGGSVFLGGIPISDEDVGYGPARYFSTEQTKEISSELSKISENQLLENFLNLVDESEIYPSFEDIEEDRKYITQNFIHLKEFLAELAKADSCLISYMC